jgi:hypothetical protein
MQAQQADGAALRSGLGGVATARRRPPSSWLTVAYLFVGGSIAAAAAGGLLGPLQSVAFLAIAVPTIAVLAISVWRRRPAHIWPWVAITVAFTLFLIGGVARYQLATTGNITASRSLIPDLITLPGYLLLAAGLLGFARSSSLEPQRKWSVVGVRH